MFETFYGKLSIARIQQLKSVLQRFQKNNTSVRGYIHQSKSLALALRSASRPVDLDDLILWTLHSLGSSFDPIVAAINSSPDAPSFEEVCGLLLDFELRLTFSSSPPPAVFPALTGSRLTP